MFGLQCGGPYLSAFWWTALRFSGCSKHPAALLNHNAAGLVSQQLHHTPVICHSDAQHTRAPTLPPPPPSPLPLFILFFPSQSGVDLGRPHCGLLAPSATPLYVWVTSHGRRHSAHCRRGLSSDSCRGKPSTLWPFCETPKMGVMSLLSQRLARCLTWHHL